MQKLDYKTFNDLLLNYKEVLNNIKESNNIDFLYKHMVTKLTNYLVIHVKEEDIQRAKNSINSFIDSLPKKNHLKLYYRFYYLIAKIYGKVKK